MTVPAPSRCPVTWTSGQLGSSMTAPALAASAPLRKVGPRFTVTEANLHILSVSCVLFDDGCSLFSMFEIM